MPGAAYRAGLVRGDPPGELRAPYNGGLIKTIIFDLGKVIVPFDLQRGYAALQPHCSYSPQDIPKRIAGTDIVRRFEMGRITPEDFVREVSELLTLKVSYQQFCELWSSIFLPQTLIPESLVKALRRSYRVLLLSNTNAIHFSMIRAKYPILRHFDDYILSYQVGAMKPDPEIYRAALDRAACLPAECFYTDDIPSYVEAAKLHGMDAVQFQSLAQLEEELRKREVKIV